MDRIKTTELEKLYGKVVDKRDLSIEGFRKKMSFELYDGFGYCADFNGHEYILKYPKMAFVRCSVEAQDAIRELLGYDKDKELTILDVLQRFNRLFRDGKEIAYNSKKKTYEEVNPFIVDY